MADGHFNVQLWRETVSGRDAPHRWLMCAGLLVLGTGGMAGCSPVTGFWQSNTWYGYYYENVMVSTAPAMSKPFASAGQCLTAMQAYTRKSATWTGFACARGCTVQKDGIVTDCAQVVR